MGDTKIEWAQLDWLEPTNNITTHVMTTYETPWTPTNVIFRKGYLTPTATFDQGVRFAGLTKHIRPWLAVLHGMMEATSHDDDVFRSVIRFVIVKMMNLLPLHQGSTEEIHCHKPMLVDVSTHIRKRVPRNMYQYISARCDDAPTLPMRVLLTSSKEILHHDCIVAHGVLR